ncbi:MAG: cyclodeaminase/cyclohydrolase family protein, partial [Acidobacteriota bacterium]|nr:cyclodeaminase/cyclohydrolase family protein [Acidobacteriota bacterium]
DAAAYTAVMQAFKAAKAELDGSEIIQRALQQATRVPLGVAERAAEIAAIVRDLQPITNPNMASDLTTAHALAHAALDGALANVAINLDSLKPTSNEATAFVDDVRRRVAQLTSL